jgi:hypothetical protein
MFKPAYGLSLWFLKTFKYKAITMPWGVVHMLPSHLHDESIRAHEAVHLEQIARMGAVKWSATYLRDLIAHGYKDKDNILESEARNKGK